MLSNYKFQSYKVWSVQDLEGLVCTVCHSYLQETLLVHHSKLDIKLDCSSILSQWIANLLEVVHVSCPWMLTSLSQRLIHSIELHFIKSVPSWIPFTVLIGDFKRKIFLLGICLTGVCPPSQNFVGQRRPPVWSWCSKPHWPSSWYHFHPGLFLHWCSTSVTDVCIYMKLKEFFSLTGNH